MDLPRALEEAGAVVGEKVVVAFGGRKEVTIDKPIKDQSGKIVGYERADVMRNTWDVAKFDRLRKDAQARVVKAAQSVKKPTTLNVFDKSAPSKALPQKFRPDNGRGQERAV